MKTLTSCGLVHSEKRGSWAYYRLNDALFAELRSYIGQLSTYKEDCICKSGGRGCSDVRTVNNESEEKQ
jgi:ArsR family transcriptional regulator